MELKINELIEKLIPLGVVEFSIDGESVYPTSYISDSDNRVRVGGDRFNLSEHDIEILSIDMVKVNSIMSVLNDLTSINGGNDVNRLDLKEYQSMKVLKDLDSMDNDIERLKYIQESLSISVISDIKNSVEFESIESEFDDGDGMKSEDESERGSVVNGLNVDDLESILNGSFASYLNGDSRGLDRFSRNRGRDYKY